MNSQSVCVYILPFSHLHAVSIYAYSTFGPFAENQLCLFDDCQATE